MSCQGGLGAGQLPVCLGRRRPFFVSSIPAPVHQSAIRALRQRLTLQQTWRTTL